MAPNHPATAQSTCGARLLLGSPPSPSRPAPCPHPACSHSPLHPPLPSPGPRPWTPTLEGCRGSLYDEAFPSLERKSSLMKPSVLSIRRTPGTIRSGPRPGHQESCTCPPGDIQTFRQSVNSLPPRVTVSATLLLKQNLNTTSNRRHLFCSQETVCTNKQKRFPKEVRVHRKMSMNV